MHSRLLITLLCAAAVALACGSRSLSQASLVTGDAGVRRAAAARHGRHAPTRAIESAFSVTTAERSVRFTLDLTNAGTRGVELLFPNGQEYEFVVLDTMGHEVWRWSRGRMFTQSVQTRMLDAGDTMRIAERASPALPRGTYVAVATLRSTNVPRHERARFQLR